MPSYDLAETLFLGLSQLKGVGYKTLRDLGGVSGVARQIITGELDEFVAAAVGDRADEGAETILTQLGEGVVTDLRSKGVDLISMGDPLFPQAFMDLPVEERPLWLFSRGRTELLSAISVAVVGTRNVTPIGEFLTRYAVSVLADIGVPVVSGLAKGVDSVAHEWAVISRIPNISILGTGILRHYPARNLELADKIVDQGGVLVSEYAPYSEPSADQFVWRNRLQAAISCCVVAPEWKRSSGTAHTIRFAKALTRPTLGMQLTKVLPNPSRGEADSEFIIPTQATAFKEAIGEVVKKQLDLVKPQEDMFGALP